MTMKSFFRAGAILFFLLIGMSVAFAANYPEPQGRMVNDFAGVLDAATKDRIEKKLRDFEKQTTNEIAIVIVPNLQGEPISMYAVELFKKWGIGKKGKDKDNGLLFLLSMKERKWRFEVGYGLEGVLNDSKCGRIAREKMVPYFKEGNFGKGIEEGLSVTMKEIAPPPPKALSLEERKQKVAEMKAAQEKEQQEKQQMEKIAAVVVQAIVCIFFLIVFIGVSFFIGKRIMKAYAKREQINREAEEIKSSLEKSKKMSNELLAHKEQINSLIASLPGWKQDEANNNVSNFYKTLLQIISYLDNFDFGKRISNNMELDRLSKVSSSISDRLEETANFFKEIENLPEKISELKETADANIAKFEQKINAVEKLAAKMKEEGYKINIDVETEAKNNRSLLSGLRKRIKDGDNPESIISAEKEAVGRLSKIDGALRNLISLRSEIEKKSQSLPETIRQLLNQKSSVGKVLDMLKAKHAEETWKDLAVRFNVIDDKLEAAKELVVSVKEQGNMNQQKFSEAAAGIRKIEEVIKGVETLFNNIQEAYNNLEKAKADYPRLFSEAKNALAEAASAVENPDVKDERKTSVENMRSNMQLVKKTVDSGNLIHWLTISFSLARVISESSNVVRLSQGDIEEAKSARRKKQQQQKQKEDSKNSDFYLSTGDGGSRKDSDGDNDSFSFGGGESGGGGAEGDF